MKRINKKTEEGKTHNGFYVDDQYIKSYVSEKNLDKALDNCVQCQGLIKLGACYIKVRTMSGRYTILWIGNTASGNGAMHTGFNTFV